MNIDIMRAFVRLRQLIENNKDIDRLAYAVTEMKALPPVTKRKFGFRPGDED